MSRRCDFPIEDLIDYADGLLTGERKATVEAHLRTCFACQRRALSSDDIGRLFREHVVGRGPGLEMEEPQPAHVVAAHQRRTVPWRVVFAAAAMLMVLLLALEPVTSLADFRLGRFVAFITPGDDGSPANVPGDQEPPGTHVTNLEPSIASIDSLPFSAIMPRELPPDLTLSEHTVSGHGSLEMLYRNDSGITIQLIEVVAGRPGATVEIDAVERILVGEDEILLQRDSPSTDSIYRAIWEHEGVLFDLWVADSPTIGLSMERIVEIVEAVIAQHDNSG